MREFIQRLLYRLSGYEQRHAAMNYAMSEIDSFVFNHAKFADDSGQSDGDYNSKQVLLKWRRYHVLVDQYYKGARGADD
jgi:hypothetical protein